MSDAVASRGGIWVVTQSVLMLAVVALGALFPGDWSRGWLTVIGFGLFGLGAYAGIAGVRALGRNRTPFPRPRPGSSLVREGIYGRVRHPLYTSVMLASAGWALIWQSWAAFGAAVVLGAFLRWKALREERWLREMFPDYEEYARRVPRFAPRRRGKG